MLESKIHTIKERLWPMGIAAFIMHGLMIAALALGGSYPQGASSQNFRAEVMFVPGSEKGESPLVRSTTSFSHCEERSDEAIQELRPISLPLPLDRHALRARDDGNYSHLPNAEVTQSFNRAHSPRHSHRRSQGKGRGEQPQKENAKSTPASAGHSFGEVHDVIPIFNPPPNYPYEAKRKGLQGIVLVQLFLTETGAVHKAAPLPPRMDPLLEEAALSAVYKWRFRSGPRILEVPIEFKLET